MPGRDWPARRPDWMARPRVRWRQVVSRKVRVRRWRDKAPWPHRRSRAELDVGHWRLLIGTMRFTTLSRYLQARHRRDSRTGGGLIARLCVDFGRVLGSRGAREGEHDQFGIVVRRERRRAGEASAVAVNCKVIAAPQGRRADSIAADQRVPPAAGSSRGRARPAGHAERGAFRVGATHVLDAAGVAVQAGGLTSKIDKPVLDFRGQHGVVGRFLAQWCVSRASSQARD